MVFSDFHMHLSNWSMINGYILYKMTYGRLCRTLNTILNFYHQLADINLLYNVKNTCTKKKLIWCSCNSRKQLWTYNSVIKHEKIEDSIPGIRFDLSGLPFGLFVLLHRTEILLFSDVLIRRYSYTHTHTHAWLTISTFEIQTFVTNPKKYTISTFVAWPYLILAHIHFPRVPSGVVFNWFFFQSNLFNL